MLSLDRQDLAMRRSSAPTATTHRRTLVGHQDRREFLKVSGAGALAFGGAIATTAGINSSAQAGADPNRGRATVAQVQPQSPAAGSLFPGFQRAVLQTSTTTINLVHGGKGRPVLLLHGWPQTHVTWHKIAPRFTQDFYVVVPDLRGYGDSGKPPEGANHEGYSKRAMAQDQWRLCGNSVSSHSR